MMQPDEVQKLVIDVLPAGAEVTVQDQTGSLDHYSVLVVSEAFKGKMLFEQHQMVQAPLAPAIKDGRLHAISIKTIVPE